MLSVRDLLRTYLDYYSKGGVKYSLQNDAAILRAIESVLSKQFETPQVLLSHIEAALAQQTRELRQSIEWSRRVDQLKEALDQAEELRQRIGQLPGRVSRLDELPDARMRRNPELILLAHLAAYLQSDVALDIGAGSGDSARGLLDAGYTVLAFEPYPPVHQKLAERFAMRSNFSAFAIAIGATDGTARLNPADAIDVEVRSLESLQRSGEIPAEAGVVKIDTDSGALQVIKGLGSIRPLVIVAKFRNEGGVPAGQEASNSLPSLVVEMRKRGYKCHVAIYRSEGLEKSRFISNTLRSPEASWGTVIFFAETLIFEKALNWCDLFL